MSNVTNDILMDRAREQCEYWTGTMHERIIQRDIEANDLEALHYHVAEAEKEMHMQEDEASDVA
jgi:hypothetical protein